MKTVNLYGISLSYPQGWQLRFGKAPTEPVGAFDLLFKREHQIVATMSVVWRPCDEISVNAMLQTKEKKSLSSRLASRGKKEPAPKPFDLSDEEMVRLYSDRIFRNLEKEQGAMEILIRESRIINGHAAEYCEYLFSVDKHQAKKGRMYRRQLILKCPQSNRLIAAYTSAMEQNQAQCADEMQAVFQSLRCHDKASEE